MKSQKKSVHLFQGVPDGSMVAVVAMVLCILIIILSSSHVIIYEKECKIP